VSAIAPLGDEHPALNQDLGRDLEMLMLAPQTLDRCR
jgi:hypothetical protein